MQAKGIEDKKVQVLRMLIPSLSDSQHQLSPAVHSIVARLDTIRKSDSVSRHFARVYFQVTINSLGFFRHADPRVIGLMERVRVGFATRFFESVDAFEAGKTPAAEWGEYFGCHRASFTRSLLLGINVHLNNDIWKTLTTELSPDELRYISPWYLSYYDQLVAEFGSIYRMVMAGSRTVRVADRMTLGLSRIYGKWLLKQWLVRQLRLANLYFTSPAQFEKEQRKLYSDIHRLNRLIKNHTHA